MSFGLRRVFCRLISSDTLIITRRCTASTPYEKILLTSPTSLDLRSIFGGNFAGIFFGLLHNFVMG